MSSYLCCGKTLCLEALFYSNLKKQKIVSTNNVEQAFVNLDAFTPQGSYAPFDLLPEWDYIALAKAFGAKGHSVATVAELQALLKELEHRDGLPSLVQVKIPLKDSLQFLLIHFAEMAILE